MVGVQSSVRTTQTCKERALGTVIWTAGYPPKEVTKQFCYIDPTMNKNCIKNPLKGA